MNTYVKTINTKYVIAFFLFSILWIPNGYADNSSENHLNRMLHGEYAFTIYRSCITVPASEGFNSATLELLEDAEHVVFVDAGIFHLDGHGNAKTLEAKVIQLNPTRLLAGQIPVSPELSSSCEGTYNVKQDKRSYTLDFSCTSDLDGGIKLTITPFKSEGHISRSRQTLTTNEIKGNIQSFTLSIDDFIIQANERICTTSGTLIKIRSAR